MLDEDGILITELFVKDGLHLSEKGYQLWSEKLCSSLELEPARRPKETLPIPAKNK